MKNNIQKAERKSLDLKGKILDSLKINIPEVISEGKIDWNKLRQSLGEHLETAAEKFNFTWAGKSGAINNVIIPSKATLRPDKKESVKFDESENIFIEGDNLEVLKLLQKSYFEKVKMIYIDPPYNTGNDFVYKDDFKSPLKNYLEQSGQVDSDGNHFSTNTQASGRFYSDWLNMMYSRLKLAWNLLMHNGVIVISIDDNEIHHLRMLMEEIFGGENYVGSLVWKKRHGQGKQTTKNNLSVQHEYLVVYQKQDQFVFKGAKRNRDNYSNPDNDPRGDWAKHPLDVGSTKEERKNCYYDLKDPKTGRVYKANPNRVWAFHPPTMKKKIQEGKIIFHPTGKTRPYLKKFWSELQSERKQLSSWIANVNESIEESDEFVALQSEYNTEATKYLNKLFKAKIFDYPKPISLIMNMIEQATNPGDIVMDFFAGSGTTAEAVWAANKNSEGAQRKFILVQLPEPCPQNSIAYKKGYRTIVDIAKDRMKRAIKMLDGKKAISEGFKVFKLDKSNYSDNLFEFDPAKSDEENEKGFKDYLKKSQKELFPDKINEIDIVYENIIKEGLDLNAKIETIKIGKNKAYRIIDADRELFVCLDEKILAEAMKVLVSVEYKGKILICFDGALSDSNKANLALNLSLKTI